jgi:transketolase
VSEPSGEPCWRELARQLRVDCVRAVAKAGSGHIPSALSAADLMAVLLAAHLRYDFDNVDNPNNDHLIFSKGHAAPLLYAMYRAAEAIDDEQLLSLRQHGSRLEGHPTPRLEWVKVATGSLGQGLPIAVGVALGHKELLATHSRVWVLCGDGEMAEGSMWEAFEHAAYKGLDNLTAILDVNRFGQGTTRQDGDTAAFAKRCRAFGWRAIEIDGHDVCEIDQAYTKARATTGRPTVIIARTVKGKGIPSIEGRWDAHSKPLADPAAAVRALGGDRHKPVPVAKPAGDPTLPGFKQREVQHPRYQVGEPVALRQPGAGRPAPPTSRRSLGSG